ncbi:MAG: N-acetylneuraminate synthase family protein [Candidatus Paceibacterota bacterium]
MTHKTKIIVEIASSHNGDIELAKAMVKTASFCGADIVKFQSWQAKNVSLNDPDRKRYEHLELSDEDHFILMEECRKCGVEFLTTCFDIGRIPFLKSLGLKRIKVPSVSLKETKLLSELGKNFDHVIVSSGMSTAEEIKNAVKTLSFVDFTIMHCVAIYPTPLHKANLEKINWLKKFVPSVGYSDHTLGTEVPIVAMSMGIDFLEKHFTLSRHLPQETHTTAVGGKQITTHQIAAEPHEIFEICQWRDFIEKTKGNLRLKMYSDEIKTRKKYTGRLGNNK